MPKRIKLLLTALTAVLAVSIAAGGASANRSIEVRGAEGGVTAEGKLTFERVGGGFRIECNVTLKRTITRLIPKISGTLFGKLTGIAFDRGGTTRSPNCRHDEIIREVHDIVPLIAPETPCTHSEDRRGILLYDCSGAEARLWKLIYDSFQGTLPRITGINFHIQGVRFRLLVLEPFGGTVECLYEGNVFGLIEIRQPGNTIGEGRAVKERNRLPRVRGSGLCPGEGTLEGRFVVRPTLTIALV